MIDPRLDDQFDFSNKTIVVTGGAQGIGESVCQGFGALGGNIAVVDIDGEGAEQTATKIRNNMDASAVAIETDVSEYEETERMVETVIGEFGSIDVLVNNAGISTRTSSFLDSEPEDWKKAVGVTFFGTMNCCHAALPHMIEQESGCIINYASDSYKGNDPSLSVYGGAKAANVAFTKTVAKEVGEHGVRMNVVSPGTTHTPATEDLIDEYKEEILDSYALERLGTTEDIAFAVLFLASDAASWITGEVLSVNGGYFRG